MFLSKQALLAFLFCYPIFLFSQNNIDYKNLQRLYEFEVECPINRCTINGKILDSLELIAPPKAKFTLIDIRQDTCVIRFGIFSKQGSQQERMRGYDNYSYFLITKAQLDFKAKPITKSDLDIVVGNVLTPLKLRFSPFDFTKDISVGTTFGIKYSINQTKQTAIDAVIGVGISTLTIDSTSSKGKTISNVDLLAFTSSLGLVFEFGNAQIGIFSGFDFISNTNQSKYSWIYKNKPWVSFGLGYSIFSFNIKKQ